jgi:hypothetical protein
MCIFKRRFAGPNIASNLFPIRPCPLSTIEIYLLAFSHWFATQRSTYAETRSSFDRSSSILFSASSFLARSLDPFFAASTLCLNPSFLSFIPFFTASTLCLNPSLKFFYLILSPDQSHQSLLG